MVGGGPPWSLFTRDPSTLNPNPHGMLRSGVSCALAPLQYARGQSTGNSKSQHTIGIRVFPTGVADLLEIRGAPLPPCPMRRGDSDFCHKTFRAHLMVGPRRLYAFARWHEFDQYSSDFFRFFTVTRYLRMSASRGAALAQGSRIRWGPGGRPVQPGREWIRI